MTPAAHTEEMLTFALAGHPVVPLWWAEAGACACGRACGRDAGKHPIDELVPREEGPDGPIRGTGGVSKATTDLTLIGRWRAKFPEMNYGVRVGDGFVVLDFDNLEEYERFKSEAPEPLPETLIIETGRGVHVWLSVPEDVEIRGNIEHVDTVKHGNAYVVGPGSIHVSGRPYKRQNGAPIAPCPPWLLAKLREHPREFTKTEGGKIPRNKRHDAWVSFAGQLHNIGLTAGQKIPNLLAFRDSAFEAPEEKTAEEARAIAEWYDDKDASHPITEAPAEKSRLVVVGADEFAVMKFPPREYILDPFFLEKNIGMVYAWRGTGKTLAVAGIALAVSTGGKFLRWQAPKARRVLLIDGELPCETLQTRILDVAKAAGLEWTKRLRILTPDMQPEGVRIPNLAETAGQKIIGDLIEAEDPELVILDNLSTLCRSGEENDAAPWQVMQDWLVWLRARRRSSLLVHHTGKAGEQRGTSKREDVLDFSIQLRRPANYQEEEGARFEAHFRKARDIHGKGIEAFEAWLRGDSWAIKSVKVATEERIRALLSDGVPPKDIAKELGVHISTVYRAKKVVAA